MCQPASCVNLLHVSTCFMCQPASCVNLLHVSTCVMCQPASCVNLRHVSTCFMCQPASCVNLLHVSTCVMCQPASCVNLLHVSTCVMCQPASCVNLLHVSSVQAIGDQHPPTPWSTVSERQVMHARTPCAAHLTRTPLGPPSCSPSPLGSQVPWPGVLSPGVRYVNARTPCPAHLPIQYSRGPPSFHPPTPSPVS
jgi:hypothetical protein